MDSESNTQQRKIQIIRAVSRNYRKVSPVKTTPDTDSESSLDDSFTANVFRSWIENKGFAFDAELMQNIRDVIISSIEKQAALQMAFEEIQRAIRSTGITLTFDNASLLNYGATFLDVMILRDFMALFGYSEDYLDSFTDAELSKRLNLNIKDTNESSKRLEDAEWHRKTMSGIHNILRDMLKSQSKPEPVSPFMLRKHNTRLRKDETDA